MTSCRVFVGSSLSFDARMPFSKNPLFFFGAPFSSSCCPYDRVSPEPETSAGEYDSGLCHQQCSAPSKPMWTANAQRDVKEHQGIRFCQSLILLPGFPDCSEILGTVWSKRPFNGCDQPTLFDIPIYLALGTQLKSSVYGPV